MSVFANLAPCSRADYALIRQIVKRADAMATGQGITLDRLSLEMDLEALHCGGCPLKLADLLAADNFNFSHDIAGIIACMDRKTGKLTKCFWPRFAEKQ